MLETVYEIEEIETPWESVEVEEARESARVACEEAAAKLRNMRKEKETADMKTLACSALLIVAEYEDAVQAGLQAGSLRYDSAYEGLVLLENVYWNQRSIGALDSWENHAGYSKPLYKILNRTVCCAVRVLEALEMQRRIQERGWEPEDEEEEEEEDAEDEDPINIE